MNFPIKPVCNSRFIRKNGSTLIDIQYCFSQRSRTLLNTEIAIPPAFWNQKKERVSEKLPEEFGSAEKINLELKRMMWTVEDIIGYASKEKVTNIGSFVKKTFKPDVNTVFLRSSHRGSKNEEEDNKRFFSPLILEQS